MKEEFYRKKIGNGMIVLFEKRKLPIANIIYSSFFGSAYENGELKGIAHLIEHMVFKGTKKRTQKEIAEAIEKVGGMINAFTAQEQTTFWTKLPSKHASVGFDVLSDIMLNPLFEEKELEKEKMVVLEEQKRWTDLPENYIFIKMRESLYKKPFGCSPLGTEDNLKRMGRAEIADFHRNNLSQGILAVVGNCDFDEILEYAEKDFKIGCKKEVSQPVIERINNEIIEKRKGLNQTHLSLGIHMPSLTEKKRYAAELMREILGGGMSSRLWQEIREKRSMAYAVHSFLEQERNYGHLIIYAGVHNEKLKETKEIILKEIKKMENLQKKDLEEAKEQIIGNFLIESENGINVGQALVLNETAGNAEEYYNYAGRINEVRVEDVRALAKINGYSFAALIP